MNPPHFTKASGIGKRRRHTAMGGIPRTSINVADTRSMYVSHMLSRLNMAADYQSQDPIQASKQQVSTAFSNNSNQLRHGSDSVRAQNRNPLLRR
jgi:hypothetical protein